MDTKHTIKIFLAEGNPTGLRTLEMMNWSGRGIIIPRDRIDVGAQRPDLETQGIYFLLGEKEETGERTMYIGESENLKDRIRSHHRNKDFWDTAICFFSPQKSLNKAHAKYLEELLIQDAKDAGRVDLENGNQPNNTRLNESDEAEVKVFAEYIKLMLSAVGYTFLKKSTDYEQNVEDVYLCSGPGAKARGVFTSEGMVVMRDSLARKEIVESAKERYLKQRPAMLEDGTLKDHDSLSYIFTKDVVFSSPSSAAQNILGRNANGWTEWKRESDNKTLDEVVRKTA